MYNVRSRVTFDERRLQRQMQDERAANLSLDSPDGGEHALSLEDLIRTIWQRLWTVGLITVLFVGGAAGFSLSQTPMYEADIKVLVGQKQSDRYDQLGSEIEGLQQLTETMTEAVGTRPVAEAIIEKLGLRVTPEVLLENLDAERLGTTQFIEVSYRDPDPEMAEKVANATGEIFSEQVSAVSPSANAITATVWERAAVPEDPVSPNLLLNLLVALVVGLMLGVALAFVMEQLDDSWRSPEEAERVSGVPTYGFIPRFQAPKKGTKKKE